MNKQLLTLVVTFISCASFALAQDEPKPAPPTVSESEKFTASVVPMKAMSWEVDGVKREAIVFAPATATTIPAPLVLAFHGHGGSSKQFARSSEFHTAWPEAIVVYPQGLPTAGMTDPQGKKAGWQNRVGVEDDRDLKFFDVMLAGLKNEFKVDDQRIYSTGHSNGGGFTYLLWGQRGTLFAAFGPSAAGAGGSRGVTFVARPLIHIAGESDTIVPIGFQKLSLTAARTLNGCDSEGTPWAKYCTQYQSQGGTPVVVCLQPGGHKYYEHATELIVKFFKEHALPMPTPTPAPAPAPPAS
ncbi:MAG: esterase [Planctomycetota bacterium]|nr:esterase [Planctomycetota bacterium]